MNIAIKIPLKFSAFNSITHYLKMLYYNNFITSFACKSIVLKVTRKNQRLELFALFRYSVSHPVWYYIHVTNLFILNFI